MLSHTAPVFCASLVSTRARFAVLQAQDELVALLRRIMWRTNKADVRDQLGVPPQMEEVPCDVPVATSLWP
jgi:hypothetical protein